MPQTGLTGVLKAHGINTYAFVDYGDFANVAALATKLSPSTIDTSVKYYTNLGFRLWPDQDISDVDIPSSVATLSNDINTVFSSFSVYGATIIGPLYGYGYNTQWYLSVYSNNPNDGEFWLTNANTTISGEALPGQPIVHLNKVPLFQLGQPIVINSGGATVESNTILSINPFSSTLTLTNNLNFSHSNGETVGNYSGTYFMRPAYYPTPPPPVQTGNLGVTIDSPGLAPAYIGVYSSINASVVSGLANYIGTSSWILADHAVNYGTEGGHSGAHNLNTYVRFVNFSNSVYYASQVISGNHTQDLGNSNFSSHTCLLWNFRGQSANYSGTTIQPSVNMAWDVDNYHKIGSAVQGTTDGFEMYLAVENAELEFGVYQYLATKTSAFLRSAMPVNVISSIQPFFSAPKETGVASTPSGSSGAFTTLQLFGGETGNYYFNWANQQDDTSNAGSSTLVNTVLSGTTKLYITSPVLSPYSNTSFFDTGEFIQVNPNGGNKETFTIVSINPFSSELTVTPATAVTHNPAEPIASVGDVGGGSFGVATSQTTYQYFCDAVPYFSHLPIYEVDTLTDFNGGNPLTNQVASTSFAHFGTLFNKMPYLGGWIGYQEDSIRLLTLDPQYGNPNTYSAFGLVAHQWGADSRGILTGSWSLSNFNVIFGLPDSSQDSNYANDIQSIMNFVSSGGNVVTYVDLQSLTTSGVSPLLGISWVSNTSGSNPVVVNPTHPVIQPYSASDLNVAFSSLRGNNGIKRTALSTSLVAIMSDTLAGPAMWENPIGLGKVIVMPITHIGDGFSDGQLNTSDGLSSGLAYLTLNAVIYVCGFSTPAVYMPKYLQRTAWAIPEDSNGRGGYSGIGLHISGTKAGQKMVWLSSNRYVPQTITINLSANFFGFGNNWYMKDVNTGEAMGGTGDIILNTKVPPQDWMVFYTDTSPSISIPTGTFSHSVIGRAFAFGQWAMGSETTSSVGVAFGKLNPSFVSGLIRFEAGGELVSTSIQPDVTTIQNVIKTSSPNAKFDLALRPFNYSSSTDLALGMQSIIVSQGFNTDSIFFDNFDTIRADSADIQNVAVNTAHAYGKFAIGDVNPNSLGAIYTKPDIITTSDWGFVMGNTMASVTAIGPPVLLHINNGAVPLIAGETEHFNWNFVFTDEQKIEFLIQLAQAQFSNNYTFMYPIFWPVGTVGPPSLYWNSSTDDSMLLAMQGLIGVYNTRRPIPGWNSTTQIPIGFGGPIYGGLFNDEITGDKPLPLYNGAKVTEKFYLPCPEYAIKVAISVFNIGNPPASMNVGLWTTGNSNIANATLTVNSTAAPVWSSFVSLVASSTMQAGYYQLIVSSTGSSTTDYYRPQINLTTFNWWDALATSTYTPPTPNPNNYGGSGTSMVWIEDSIGYDLTIIPSGRTFAPPTTNNFVAAGNYQVNSIVPWLSDMHYAFKPYNVKFTLTDTTTSTLVGSASATQYYNSHGTFGIIPFQFSSVSLVAGHTYQVALSNDITNIYDGLLRGSEVNPASAAPSEQSPYWWGLMANVDFTPYRILDYGSTHISAPDGIGTFSGSTGQTAVRFVPNFNETLRGVSLKMYDGLDTLGNFSSGVPIRVAIYASNENASNNAGAQPTGSIISSVSVDSGTIPVNGWFNVAGPSCSLSAGTPYWVVWNSPITTTNSQGGYGYQRVVSAWRYLMQITEDSIPNWAYPEQGPTDLAFKISTSNEFIGAPFDTNVNISIDTQNYVAEPFILNQNATATAVYTQLPQTSIGPTTQVTIYPSNGPGTAPNMASPLGTGTYNSTFLYTFNGEIIPLNTPVSITISTKYWVVFSAPNGASVVNGLSYWTRPTDPNIPSGYELLTSNTSGSSWSQSFLPNIGAVQFMLGILPSGAVSSGPPPPPPGSPSGNWTIIYIIKC